MPLLMAVTTYLACFLLLIVYARIRFCTLAREAQIRTWKEAHMLRERTTFLRASTIRAS